MCAADPPELTSSPFRFERTLQHFSSMPIFLPTTATIQKVLRFIELLLLSRKRFLVSYLIQDLYWHPLQRKSMTTSSCMYSSFLSCRQATRSIWPESSPHAASRPPFSPLHLTFLALSPPSTATTTTTTIPSNFYY